MRLIVKTSGMTLSSRRPYRGDLIGPRAAYRHDLSWLRHGLSSCGLHRQQRLIIMTSVPSDGPEKVPARPEAPRGSIASRSACAFCGERGWRAPPPTLPPFWSRGGVGPRCLRGEPRRTDKCLRPPPPSPPAARILTTVYTFTFQRPAVPHPCTWRPRVWRVPCDAITHKARLSPRCSRQQLCAGPPYPSPPCPSPPYPSHPYRRFSAARGRAPCIGPSAIRMDPFGIEDRADRRGPSRTYHGSIQDIARLHSGSHRLRETGPARAGEQDKLLGVYEAAGKPLPTPTRRAYRPAGPRPPPHARADTSQPASHQHRPIQAS